MAVIDAITDLSLLGPGQRAVVELLKQGMSRRDVSDELGITVGTIQNHITAALKIARTGRAARQYEVDDSDDETPRQAHDRIRADLIAGRRCGAPLGRGNCWLLTPCADHER